MLLLDTNVISEMRKIESGKADRSVSDWVGRADPEAMYLSTITIQELEIGVLGAERKDIAKGRLLRNWLEGRVLPLFGDRILPVDIRIARRSAALHVPNPRPFRDALIAATGLVHAMTVVTRNVSDFEPMGVALFNPWDGPA